MNNIFRSDSGGNIIYIDHSTSGIGASLYHSSSDPISLADLMRNNTFVVDVDFPEQVLPTAFPQHTAEPKTTLGTE